MAGRLEHVLQRDVAGFSLAEWLPAALLAAWTVVEVPTAPAERVQGPRAVLVAVGVASALLLLLRVRRPLAVLLGTSAVVAAPVLVWGASQLSAVVLTVVIPVFACGRYARRPWAYAAPFVMGAGALVQAWKDPLDSVAASWTWSLNGLWIFGLGAWLRQKSTLDVAARAEAEAVAREQAAQDRVQIARDLHDVLAHNLAVMVLQAEAADALLDDDPGRARVAIGTVQGTGRHALRDVRGLLAALRSGGPAGDVAPAGLAGLAGLVDVLGRSGLPVTLLVTGDVSGVPAAQGVVAYRTVQEALTNTVRHAGNVVTEVSVEIGDGLLVEVRDSGLPVAAPVVGHGLRGMQERAEALGGQVQAGPAPGGGFLVRLELPLEATA